MADANQDGRRAGAVAVSTTGAISPPLLSVKGIAKRFGGVVALDDVTFEVAPTTITGLIGPNGSGKTTLLNVINGVFRPDSGNVRFRSEVITGLSPSDLASSGVARTFQTARVFRTLTTMQNLFIPLLHHGRIERSAAGERARELLDFVGLESFASLAASELSGGQQRLLEFARALVTQPSLILMDEPFAGVHPEIKRRLIGCIKDAVARDCASFIIVSHEVPDLVAMSDAMLCLVGGRVAAAGAPDSVVRDPRVVEGYLGGGESAA
jgi:ABC-type branched-subunit amino acid transport system ATPase component